jgi:hypothetical protein
MADQTQAELEAKAIQSLGSLLAKKRWDNSTPEQRAKQNRLMLAGRKRKAKRGKK